MVVLETVTGIGYYESRNVGWGWAKTKNARRVNVCVCLFVGIWGGGQSGSCTDTGVIPLKRCSMMKTNIQTTGSSHVIFQVSAKKMTYLEEQLKKGVID